MAKVDNKTFIAIWLFNPVISAIYLIRNIKENTSIFPYLLLSFFFGFSFIVSTTGGDSERYAAELLKYHRENLTLIEVIQGFYSGGNSKLDIYQPILTWLVSIYTDNPKVLFALFAIVFGYFWFKSLIIIRSYIDIPLQGLALLSFTLLALTNPIWYINGVRMWTAVGIFFYGIVLLHLQKNKKGWIFLILPIFIHFSLILSVLWYIIYRLIPTKNLTVLMVLFVVTFFLGELNLDVVRDYFKLLPDLFQSKESYISDEYAEGVRSSGELLATHVIWAGILMKYSILIMAAITYYFINVKKRISDINMNVFFPMALYFLIFSNLASSVPSGIRFAVVSNLILITSFLFLLGRRIILNPVLKFFLNCSLLFVIIFLIRTGLDFLGLLFFIGNPIVNWFVEENSVMEFIKSIFR